MKALAWILTAAAILIGADTFVMSPDDATALNGATQEEAGTYNSMEGGNGIPTRD